MDNKNILILFDGPHLAFSPTTIQLYDELSKHHTVTIIAQDPKNYNGQYLNDRNVLYHKYYGVKGRHFYLALFKILCLFQKEAKNFKKNGLNYRDYFFKYLFIKKYLSNISIDRIVCIDIINLFFCYQLKLKVDFLSLELCKDEHLMPLIDKKFIECVIIQSIERYKYLFKEENHPLFYVQNAPNFVEISLHERRKGVIHAGGAYDELGFYQILDYIKKYKDETLTVQGAFLQADKERVNREYTELLADERLIISTKYLENDEVVSFISQYEIGFCFYNFNNTYVKQNYFNYASAPSGKMFKYLAAGVPVVCSNIIGFKFVAEFDCGVLLDEPTEESIREAILTIRGNYSYYVENCLKAARYFSFDKAIIPYMEFIG